MELEVKVCEEIKLGMHTALCFLMLQLEILISYVAGPDFRFRCYKRVVRMGISWCLGWQSVI